MKSVTKFRDSRDIKFDELKSMSPTQKVSVSRINFMNKYAEFCLKEENLEKIQLLLQIHERLQKEDEEKGRPCYDVKMTVSDVLTLFKPEDFPYGSGIKKFNEFNVTGPSNN